MLPVEGRNPWPDLRRKSGLPARGHESEAVFAISGSGFAGRLRVVATRPDPGR
jgi:hypothetical protein